MPACIQQMEQILSLLYTRNVSLAFRSSPMGWCKSKPSPPRIAMHPQLRIPPHLEQDIPPPPHYRELKPPTLLSTPDDSSDKPGCLRPIKHVIPDSH